MGDGDVAEGNRRLLVVSAVLTTAQYLSVAVAALRKPIKQYHMRYFITLTPGFALFVWLGSYLATELKSEASTHLFGCILAGIGFWAIITTHVIATKDDDMNLRVSTIKAVCAKAGYHTEFEHINTGAARPPQLTQQYAGAGAGAGDSANGADGIVDGLTYEAGGGLTSIKALKYEPPRLATESDERRHSVSLLPSVQSYSYTSANNQNDNNNNNNNNSSSLSIINSVSAKSAAADAAASSSASGVTVGNVGASIGVAAGAGVRIIPPHAGAAGNVSAPYNGSVGSVQSSPQSSTLGQMVNNNNVNHSSETLDETSSVATDAFTPHLVPGVSVSSANDASTPPTASVAMPGRTLFTNNKATAAANAADANSNTGADTVANMAHNAPGSLSRNNNGNGSPGGLLPGAATANGVGSFGGSGAGVGVGSRPRSISADILVMPNSITNTNINNSNTANAADAVTGGADKAGDSTAQHHSSGAKAKDAATAAGKPAAAATNNNSTTVDSTTVTSVGSGALSHYDATALRLGFTSKSRNNSSNALGAAGNSNHSGLGRGLGAGRKRSFVLMRAPTSSGSNNANNHTVDVGGSLPRSQSLLSASKGGAFRTKGDSRSVSRVADHLDGGSTQLHGDGSAGNAGVRVGFLSVKTVQTRGNSNNTVTSRASKGNGEPLKQALLHDTDDREYSTIHETTNTLDDNDGDGDGDDCDDENAGEDDGDGVVDRSNVLVASFAPAALNAHAAAYAAFTASLSANHNSSSANPANLSSSSGGVLIDAPGSPDCRSDTAGSVFKFEYNPY